MLALVMKSPVADHPRTPWRCDMFGWAARLTAGRGRTLTVRFASFRASDPTEAKRAADQSFDRLARLIARQVRGVPDRDRVRRRRSRPQPAPRSAVAGVPAAVTQLTVIFRAEGV